MQKSKKYIFSYSDSNSNTTVSDMERLSILLLLLAYFIVHGETSNNTTVTPMNTSSSAATTTTATATTTINPNVLREMQCYSTFQNWLPDFNGCIDPVNECFEKGMKLTNDYLECKAFLKAEPSRRVADESSAIVFLHLQFYAKEMIHYFLFKKKNDPALRHTQLSRRERIVSSKFIWIAGFQIRYSHYKWPDYHEKEFQPNRTWNNRNDSVYVPYGNLASGEYRYRFALYDNLITGKIKKQLVRLKKTWVSEHPIHYGYFITYVTDKDLYFNENLQINSAVLQLLVEPVRKHPLPGYNVISFTHLKANMHKPVCVYWQVVDDHQPNQLQIEGYWTNYGMKVEKTNSSMTICLSSQFGTFALLMEPNIAPDKESISILDLLTIIMSVIAILMLIVYVVSMGMLKCFETIHSRMYVYLALSVIFSHFSFLIGFFYRDDFETCTSISTAMGYSCMLIVSWVSMESVHQLHQINNMFNPKTSLNAFYIFNGLGIPLAVLIAMQEFPYAHFDELQYCWPSLEDKDLLYFAIPILVTIIVVATLRGITFLKIRKEPKKVKNDINYIRALQGIKSSAVFLTTYIIYWLVGTIGVKEKGGLKEVIQVCLPLLNICISGEIIFFYFYRNDEVNDALQEQRKIIQRKRFKNYNHLAGINMDVKYISMKGDSKEIEEKEEEEKESQNVSVEQVNGNDSTHPKKNLSKISIKEDDKSEINKNNETKV